MEWISVKDKLPPINTDVLLFFDVSTKNVPFDSRMQIGWLYERMTSEYETEEEKKDILRWATTYNPIYWMPLPQPPKDT